MSLLTHTPAETAVKKLIGLGVNAEASTKTLAEQLAKADADTKRLLGKERLDRLTALAAVAEQPEDAKKADKPASGGA